MSITGEPDGPPVKVGVPLTDLGAALFALSAILAALHYRTRTGLGQYIDTSLVDAGVALSVWEATEFFSSGGVPPKTDGIGPPDERAHTRRSAAPMASSRWPRPTTACSRGSPTRWAMPSGPISRSSRPTRRAWPTARRWRRGSRPSRPSTAAGRVAGPSSMPAGCPCGPINDYAQVFADPHIAARGMVAEVESSDARPRCERSAPRSSSPKRRRSWTGRRPCLASTPKRYCAEAGFSPRRSRRSERGLLQCRSPTGGQGSGTRDQGLTGLEKDSMKRIPLSSTQSAGRCVARIPGAGALRRKAGSTPRRRRRTALLPRYSRARVLGQPGRLGSQGPPRVPQGLSRRHRGGRRGGLIYWSNMGRSSDDDGSIERADLNGNQYKIVVPPGGTHTAKQLKLDKKNGKLYWSDREGMRVMRSNVDGSKIETLVEVARGDAARADAVELVRGHCRGRRRRKGLLDAEGSRQRLRRQHPTREPRDAQRADGSEPEGHRDPLRGPAGAHRPRPGHRSQDDLLDRSRRCAARATT